MQGDKYVTISEVYFTLETILDRLEDPGEAVSRYIKKLEYLNNHL